MDMIGQRPELMNIFGDLMFKNLDIPGAEVISKRIKNMIPKEITAGEDESEQDPQLNIMAEQLEQMQQQNQELMQQVQAASMELQAVQNDQQLKTQLERAKLELDAKKMQTSLQEQLIAAELKREELSLKRLELEIKSSEAVQASRIDALEEILEQLKPLIVQSSTDN
jgi:hypothetical protein